MKAGRLALAAGGAWLAYAWGAHLVTPWCVWRGPSGTRRIALTFDDGPDPDWTPRILDILAAHDVTGTFFVVGERATRALAAVTAAARAGHEIASHGWSHRSLWRCGPRRTFREVERTQALLTEVAGRPPRHFRPPWGMVNAALYPALHRAGLRCVFWSIQPEGRRPCPPGRQVERVVARAHPGAIVDLHDADGVPGAPARLVAALPGMIQGLRERGYDFATVTDLLGDTSPRR